jgi:hypothetical protein
MDSQKMKTPSTGARPEHSFAPVIGINGCVGHLIWTARGVRAFDADDKEVGTYPTMDAAAAALLALSAGAMLSVGAPPAATHRPARS